jgi:isochorismate pyruvate lyase
MRGQLRGRATSDYAVEVKPRSAKGRAMTDPQDCQTMTDVRSGVDAVDRELVALLGRRFGYMDAAARIKSSRTEVRDEARKAQVKANVRSYAAQSGLPVALADELWELLIEASIAYELEVFDAR